MRSVSRFVVALVWAAVVLAPSLVFAQASITGTVRDTSGGVLPGVTVEAASPVLIEKVRTVVTDGNGRYQIVDLRPGAYTVTFSLPGFNTVLRDGVTLAGSAAVSVDADMRVGALEETITVTGEAPVVDTQTLTQQAVMNADTIDALPSARNYFGLARMIPSTVGGGNDVGGSAIQDVGQSVRVHGSRNTDQRITINGVNTMTLQAGGNIGGQTPDVGSAAEITVDTTSLGADLPTGGVRVNFIPKDGGNTFANSTFVTFANDAMQGDNFDQELQDRGLGTPNQLLHTFDLNESFGGPIKRDKLWFWFSTRYNNVASQAPVFRNLNEFNPNEWLYVPDTNTPGENLGSQTNNSIRVTWQATPRNKIAGTFKADTWCNCPNNISAVLAPEAARDRRFPNLKQEHLEWTSPVTNRLLLEAVGMQLYERWGNMHLRASTGSVTPEQEAILPQMISVLEQSNNLRYRSLQNYNNTSVPSLTYRAAASYVTGTHAFKFGMNNTTGHLWENQYVLNGVNYRFNNGVPNQLEMRQNFIAETNLDRDMGFYAQDRVTLDRLTISLAARLDFFKTSFPEQTLGPDPLGPSRNITFPAQDNIDWKDFTYRSGLAWDVFGTGRTAVKVGFNKYLLGQTLNGLGRDPNPVLAMVTNATRPWNDANRNFVPDCDLLNFDPNGECGVISNRNLGNPAPAATFDPDLISGWNNRQTNWELSTSVAHEVARGIGVDVGYFRRAWANFRVTDNLAVTAADFTQYSMTAPSDPRLPGGGGYTVSGLYDVIPSKFGQIQNYNTLSSKIGDQTETWNGMDFAVNARLQNGLTLQGGYSFGRVSENDCEIVAQLPEMLTLTAGNASGTANGVAQLRSANFCDRQEPWLSQFKMYGVYTVPTVDVQVSGTFRSTNGTDLAPGFVATNAYLAANSTLGRPLAGGRPNQVTGLVAPYTEYTERRNELDIRFGKVVRFGRSRSVISLDVFNALNSNALIAMNQAFATYTRPTEILNARLLKVSYTLDF
ncbi:MAG: TonB-dependent receptor [Acidobacteria bacterium]|nr:TonB-dependent receptor [Acidobacteriota bacterium]